MHKNTRNWMLALAGLISAGTFTSESHAVPVPDAIYSWTTQGPAAIVVGHFPGDTQWGTITQSHCNDYGCFTGTATTTPELLAQASGTFTGLISGAEAGPLGSVNNPIGDFTVGVQGSASIQYFFEVIGPADQFVPLTITGDVSSSSVSGDINAHANTSGSISYEYVGSGGIGGGFAVSCSILYGSCGPTSMHLNDSFSVLTNSIGTVNLNVSARTEGVVSSSYMVMADPTIRIDPTFLASNPGYSLEFSSNISAPPSTSVPESSTVLLLGAGILGLAAWRWKHAA